MPFTIHGTPVGATTIATGLMASMGGFLVYQHLHVSL